MGHASAAVVAYRGVVDLHVAGAWSGHDTADSLNLRKLFHSAAAARCEQADCNVSTGLRLKMLRPATTLNSRIPGASNAVPCRTPVCSDTWWKHRTPG